MLRLRFAFLTLLVVGALAIVSLPALAGEEVVIDAWVVDKVVSTVDGWTEYIYSMDYMRDYDYDGPINDFHAHLGEWTPGEIQIIPPENWSGTYQGGTYGCETNTHPYTYGNYYAGSWKIRVKPGYGDGTGYFVWTQDNVPVGHHDGVLIPMVPEPSSLLALGSGLTALLGMALRKRR